jgi:molybdopterin-guanine dinucleotide biosynthesis protein A
MEEQKVDGSSAIIMKIAHLYISPGHNFFGHHEQPPGMNPLLEKSEIQCIAGRGIPGDRFFDFKDNYKGQITFFSLEVFEDICQRLKVHGKSPGVTRRNVIATDVDLNTLIGEEFEVQGVRFAGIAECSPCYWMDLAVAPGAEKLMQGRGGLRARILTDGTLVAEQMNHSAVILAGGRSSRMGKDKAWMEIGGRTLLERQIEIAHETGAAEVFISGRPDVDYSNFAYQVLHDNFPDAGPLAGIEQALATAKSPRVLVLAVDLPEISASLLHTLAVSNQKQLGAIPRVNGKIEPLAAFYPKEAQPLATELLRSKENSVINFAARCVREGIAAFCDLPANQASYFTNWNSPSDLLSVS